MLPTKSFRIATIAWIADESNVALSVERYELVGMLSKLGESHLIEERGQELGPRTRKLEKRYTTGLDEFFHCLVLFDEVPLPVGHR